MKTLLRCFVFLIFFSISLSIYGQETSPLAVYLTWQRSPESTMTIRWITSENQYDDQIEYKKEDTPGHWNQTTGTHHPMPGESPYLIHSVELTNLHPESPYLFRLPSNRAIYKFRTMPATLHSPIRFVAGGDMYHDTLFLLKATNRQAAKADPHFALVGGDIAYAADKKLGFLPRWTQPLLDNFLGQKSDRWLAWLTAWKNEMITPDGYLIPLLPVLGNHDTNGRFGQTPLQAPFFYSLFAMPGPQGYNVLDFGNYMSIFFLDSGHTHSIDGPQTQWLKRTLEERKEVPHKFALYHVPAYPSVRSFNNEISLQIRKYWTPLFDKYRLTAAFENHDHAYKRTFPLLGGKVDPKGVLYFGDGAWGVAKPRQPGRQWYLAQAIGSRHFLMAIIHQDKRYLSAITPNNELLDEISW